MPPGVLAPEAPAPVAVVERPTSVPSPTPEVSQDSGAASVGSDLEQAQVGTNTPELFQDVADGSFLPSARSESVQPEVPITDPADSSNSVASEAGASYPQNAQDIIAKLDPDIAGILGHGDVNAGMGKLLRHAAQIQQLGRYGVKTRDEAIAHAVAQARALEEKVHEPMRKKYGASLPDKLAQVERANAAASRAEAAKLAGADVELSPTEHSQALAEEKERLSAQDVAIEAPGAVVEPSENVVHVDASEGVHANETPEIASSESTDRPLSGTVSIDAADTPTRPDILQPDQYQEFKTPPSETGSEEPLEPRAEKVRTGRVIIVNEIPPEDESMAEEWKKRWAETDAQVKELKQEGDNVIHILNKDGPQAYLLDALDGKSMSTLTQEEVNKLHEAYVASQPKSKQSTSAVEHSEQTGAIVTPEQRAALQAGASLEDVQPRGTIHVDALQSSAPDASGAEAHTEQPNDANVARLLAGMRDGVSVDGDFSDADRRRAEALHEQAADVYAEIARSERAASAPDLSGMNPYGEQPPGPWDVGSELPVATEPTNTASGQASERHSAASPEPRQRREAIGDMADMVAHLDNAQVSGTEAQEQALLHGEGGRAERSAVDRVGEAQEHARVGGAPVIETSESVVNGQGRETADAAVATVSEPAASDQQRDQYDAQGNLIRVPAEQPSTYDAEAAALRRPAIIEDAVKRMRAGEALPDSLTADEKKQVFAAAEKQLAAEEKKVQEAVARNTNEVVGDDDDLSDEQRAIPSNSDQPDRAQPIHEETPYEGYQRQRLEAQQREVAQQHTALQGRLERGEIDEQTFGQEIVKLRKLAEAGRNGTVAEAPDPTGVGIVQGYEQAQRRYDSGEITKEEYDAEISRVQQEAQDKRDPEGATERAHARGLAKQFDDAFSRLTNGEITKEEYDAEIVRIRDGRPPNGENPDGSEDDKPHDPEVPGEPPLPDPEPGTLAHRLENNLGVPRAEAQDPAFQRAYEIALAQAQDVALGGNVDQGNTGLLATVENRVMGFKAPGTKIDAASVVENARRIKIGQERASGKAKEDTDAVRDFFTPKVSIDPAVTERGSVLSDEQTEEFIDLYSDPDFHLAFAKTSKDASITGKTEEERKQQIFDRAKKLTEQIKTDREKTNPRRSPEQQALDRQVRLGKQLEAFGLDVNPFDAGFQKQFLAELSRVEAGLKPGVEVDVKTVAQSVVSGYRRENNLPYADMRIIEPNLSDEDRQKREENAKAYEAKKSTDKKAVAEGTFGVVATTPVESEIFDDESGLVVESTAEHSATGVSEQTSDEEKDDIDMLRDEEVDAIRAEEAAAKAEKDAADARAAEIARQEEVEELQDAAAAAYDKKIKGLSSEVVAKLKKPEGYEKSKEREEQREKAAILLSVEEAKQRRREKEWDEILEQSAESGITPEDFTRPEDAQAFQAAIDRKARREAQGGVVDAVADADAVAREQQAWNQITELGITIVPGDTPASVRNRINQVMQFAGKPLWEADADTDMFISAAITKATRGEKEVASVSPSDTAEEAKTDEEKVAQAEQRAVEAEAKVQAMQQLLDRAEAALRAPAPPKDEASVESTTESVTVPEAETDEEKQAVALAQQASKAEGEEKKKLVEKVTNFLFGEDGSRRKNVSQGVAMVALLIMAGVYEGLEGGMKH